MIRFKSCRVFVVVELNKSVVCICCRQIPIFGRQKRELRRIQQQIVGERRGYMSWQLTTSTDLVRIHVIGAEDKWTGFSENEQVETISRKFMLIISIGLELIVDLKISY